MTGSSSTAIRPFHLTNVLCFFLILSQFASPINILDFTLDIWQFKLCVEWCRKMGIPSICPLKWRLFQMVAWDTIYEHLSFGDKFRQQTFFAFLLPSSKHHLGVQSSVWFLLQLSLTAASNESSVHCLSAAAASFMCHPVCNATHTKRQRLRDTCEPHEFRSLSPSFFCFLTSYTSGFSYYVIISLLKKHRSFPNICFFSGRL